MDKFNLYSINYLFLQFQLLWWAVIILFIIFYFLKTKTQKLEIREKSVGDTGMRSHQGALPIRVSCLINGMSHINFQKTFYIWAYFIWMHLFSTEYMSDRYSDGMCSMYKHATEEYLVGQNWFNCEKHHSRLQWTKNYPNMTTDQYRP